MIGTENMTMRMPLSPATILFPEDAHDYLDLGTGSYAVQVVPAMVFTGLYELRLYRTRVRAVSKRIFSANQEL